MNHAARLTVLICMVSSTLMAGSFRDDFAVVFIDAASEAKLGAFPFDRSIEARALRKARDLGARGVVLKFFFDQAKTPREDQALAASLTNLPVILQACLDETEAHPNPLPDRFVWHGGDGTPGTSGKSGWIPLPILLSNAFDVGFVDFDSTQIPLLETYQSRTVKSLVVRAIELATGTRAMPASDQTMKFGKHLLRLDGSDCATAILPSKDDLDYIPFHTFLSGEILPAKIKGKVVIIGYDGPRIQSVSTSIGPIRAHRFFVYVLRSLYDQTFQ